MDIEELERQVEEHRKVMIRSAHKFADAVISAKPMDRSDVFELLIGAQSEISQLFMHVTIDGGITRSMQMHYSLNSCLCAAIIRFLYETPMLPDGDLAPHVREAFIERATNGTAIVSTAKVFEEKKAH